MVLKLELEHQEEEDTPVADTGGAELVPEFRVVVSSERRRGIRLEQLYWRLLNEIAERRNLRRAQLMATVLEDADRHEYNSASALRAFTVNELDQERRRLQKDYSEDRLVSMLFEAPVPAFAINRQKKIQRANPEFMKLLRIVGGDMSKEVSREGVGLKLDLSIETLFDQVEQTGNAVYCHYELTLGERGRRGRVKLQAVPTRPLNLLLGYLTS